MNKQQFLAAIEKKLEGMQDEDLRSSLDYYEEMLNDRIDDGMTEEEAVKDMGSVDEITAQILEDQPLALVIRDNIKEKIKPSRSLRAWEIVLIVLGSPLWISLLAAGFAIAVALAAAALSLYVVMWVLVGVLWICVAAQGLGAVTGIGWSIAGLFIGRPMQSLLTVGCGLVCGGAAILMFYGALLATKGLAKGTAAVWKALFGSRNK